MHPPSCDAQGVLCQCRSSGWRSRNADAPSDGNREDLRPPRSTDSAGHDISILSSLWHVSLVSFNTQQGLPRSWPAALNVFFSTVRMLTNSPSQSCAKAGMPSCEGFLVGDCSQHLFPAPPGYLADICATTRPSVSTTSPAELGLASLEHVTPASQRSVDGMLAHMAYNLETYRVVAEGILSGSCGLFAAAKPPTSVFARKLACLLLTPPLLCSSSLTASLCVRGSTLLLSHSSIPEASETLCELDDVDVGPRPTILSLGFIRRYHPCANAHSLPFLLLLDVSSLKYAHSAPFSLANMVNVTYSDAGFMMWVPDGAHRSSHSSPLNDTSSVASAARRPMTVSNGHTTQGTCELANFSCCCSPRQRGTS